MNLHPTDREVFNSIKDTLEAILKHLKDDAKKEIGNETKKLKGR